MKKSFLVPPRSRKGQLRMIYFFLLVSVLMVAGCSTSNHKLGLAPIPPEFTPKAEREDISRVAIRDVSEIETASGSLPTTEGVRVFHALSPKSQDVKKCRIKDRFDRKEVLAYEWGDNRLGFDVGGLNLADFGDFNVERVRVAYRLKLQPNKSKKERCLYPSSWKGIVGTSYNELFIRETDTVWDELDLLQKDIEDRWESLVY